jgi:dihydrofolate reductase
MRKVIVSLNTTLDGFMAGTNCELDWHFDYWDEEMSFHASELLMRADTILFGRVTYQAMAKYWSSIPINMSYAREDVAFADMINRYQKIVFSRTLQTTSWNNSRIVGDNIREELLRLKRMPGRDMIIYGSGNLISTLMHLGLIDEYVLWIHPVIIGKGKPGFGNIIKQIPLRFINIKKFSSGVVALYYDLINQHVIKNEPNEKVYFE